MKILAISAMAIETPAKSYGGLETVVYNHCKGLADLGEDVTLLGAKGSVAPKGVKCWELEEPGLFDISEEKAFWWYRHILPEYDVVLDHSWYKWTLMAGDYLPVISTMHSPCPYNRTPPKKYPMFCGVSTEHSILASKVLGLPVRTTWNSVDVARFPFSKSPGDNTLLSINRIDPDKGIHVFIDWVSRLDGKFKGDIVGDDSLVRDPVYPQNVRKSCELYKIKFSGKVSHEDKLQKIKDCRAVVLLPQAPKYYEVFGLAAVEANAMGKPVICTPNCGLKSVIENGVTGFHVETFAQFKDAVEKLDTISPEACRKQAEKFDIPAITPKYRDMIKKVNEGCRW